MATHTELISRSFGNVRFCLDRVVRDDEEDERIEYAFVWRGTASSPDGFVHRPAYFNFELLGEILREAITREDILQREEVLNLLQALFGVSRLNDS